MSERTIWKYPLQIHGEAQGVRAPMDGRIIHVHEQNGEAVIWMLVSPDAPDNLRRFRVVGTGHLVKQGVYVGTIHSRGFVWHVFEEFDDAN